MVYAFTRCILVLPCLVEAMVSTKYMQISPQGSTDLIHLCQFAGDFKYCACNVSEDTCQPLTSDWCGTMETVPNTTYFIKEMITEMLVNHPIYTYQRDLPIYLHPGSEIEFQFTLHAGWTRLVVDLSDDVGNIVLHVKMFQSYVVFNTCRGHWGVEEILQDVETYINIIEVIRTLKIMCTLEYFMISLDGSLEWKYYHRLPASSVHHVAKFYQTPVTLHRITYKAGPYTR